MGAKMIITYRDYGIKGERSAVTFPGDPVVEANIAAQTTLQNALRDALAGIVIGTRVKITRVQDEVLGADVNPANQYAQRESKWLVRYHDATTSDKYTLEIPTANLSLLSASSDDVADMGNAAITAFITAFEAYVKPPSGGDAVVDEIRFVGRKS